MGRPEFYYDFKREQYRKRARIDGIYRDFWGGTKEEVRALVQQAKENEKKGLVFGDETVLWEYAKEWLPAATAHLTPSGKRDYDNALNVHILPALGNMKLRDIRPLYIDKLMLQSADKSRSLQAKILSVARRLFDSARANGLILSNPTDKKSPGGKRSALKTPLTAAQQAALLEAVKDTRAETFVALGLYAGLRREEILGLAWSDVHFGDTPYLEVTHAVRFDKSKPTRSKTLKSKAAARKIPMPPELVAALKKQRQKMQDGKMLASFLVVPDSKGQLCSLNAIRKLWEIVERREINGEEASKHSPKIFKCEKTLGFHCTPHLLRHTYITTLCASGMDIKKIQYLAGHETVEMTLNIYTKVVHNQPEDMYEAVKDAFKPKTEKAESEQG